MAPFKCLISRSGCLFQQIDTLSHTSLQNSVSLLYSFYCCCCCYLKKIGTTYQWQSKRVFFLFTRIDSLACAPRTLYSFTCVCNSSQFCPFVTLFTFCLCRFRYKKATAHWADVSLIILPDTVNCVVQIECKLQSQ